MVGLLVVAVLVSKLPTAAPAPSTAAAPALAAKEAAAEPAPAAAGGDELKKLVEGLAAQVKALEAKVGTLPKPEPAADLKPIQAKLDDLTKSVAPVAALSEKVDKLDERLGALDGAVKSVKDETAALSGEVKKVAAGPKPESEPKAESTAADTSTTLAQGADLFKAGKYKEAAEVFKKLEAGSPKDARVYYYAALANGLTTGDWKTDTLKIAARGAELEKAGEPRPAEVDAAFSALPATLKPWLAYFRKPARR
jgi:hypothetical protein